MKFLFSKSRRNRLARPKSRQLAAESLETRRVLAASVGWDGPGLGSAELTYTISGTPDSLSRAEVETAVETALDAWSSVVDITFTETNQTGLRDSLDLSFGNIDGAGGTLAQAYFPDDVNPDRIAGDIQFDASERWEVGNAEGNRAFDLTWVAAHEIGHALGLAHASEVGSVLRAFTTPNQTFTSLDPSDVAEIQELYAANTDAPAPGSTTQPGPTTDGEIIPGESNPEIPGLGGQADPDGLGDPDLTPDTGNNDFDPFDGTDQNRRSFWQRFHFQFISRFHRSWRFTSESFDAGNSDSGTDANADDTSTTSIEDTLGRNAPRRFNRFFFRFGR